ncbi:MAG: hypothetical protein IIY16_00895, partial [Oscillospiraceae bacterium]|nr:hypothetical protein [Oscillospiraceae bacterium]
VLAEAQKLGYAEADPTADIDGWDIRRKIVISSNIAYGVSIREEDVAMAGIRYITAEDIAAFKENDLTCKMIATSFPVEGGIAASVEPTLIAAGSPEAAVPNNYNRICVESAALGPVAFFGQGAGRFPTAVNVVQDCLDILAGCRSFYTDKAEPCRVCNDSVERAYYVRSAVPGAFDDIAVGKMGGGVITKPIAVSEMHRRAGAEDFFAALPCGKD